VQELRVHAVLKPRELHCIDLVRSHLASTHGGAWRVTADLDAENPTVASPEVRIDNGLGVTAAIEIKSVTVAELARYNSWKPSLERSLQPACQGHFVLVPCSRFALPLDKPIVQHLRRELARVAPTLPPGKVDVILVPRDGYVVRESSGPAGSIHCLHDFSEDLQAVASRLDGGYFLIDGDQGRWSHSFVTDAARAEWHDKIVAACSTPTVDGHFTWTEEWELHRVDDGFDDEPRVEILAVSDVFTGGSADTAVWAVLEAGRSKFHQRWADHHILAFDSRVPLINSNRLAAIASEFDPSDLGAVEMILLIEGGELTQIWPKRLAA